MPVETNKPPSLDEIRQLLRRSPAQTVRRVLPRDFVAGYIHYYMEDIQAMIKSFQAILTFPTTGRHVPQQFMDTIQERLSQDLRASAKKTDSEVNALLASVNSMKVMQSTIMLDVLSDMPFPYCLLNTVEYPTVGNNFVACYVILWAQQPGKGQPISVWAQLAPRSGTLAIPPEKMKSDIHLIRLPTGQAEFHAFNTVISVTLYDVPTQADATLAGKTLPELLRELRMLRDTLVRRKEQRGNFLHLKWTKHQAALSRYVGIEEMTLA